MLPDFSGAYQKRLKVVSFDMGNFLLSIIRAVEPGPGGGVGQGPITLLNPLGTESIIEIVNRVLNFLIYISVPILALMILVGGFQILTARDSPEKVQNGRKTIMWASIGFVVILASKGVALILLKIIG